MADPTQPILQPCTNCGAQIDVSAEEPFASIPCPECGRSLRVRRHFDHFEMQEILGAGGMGTVYRALDMNLNRTVAIKLLRKEYSANPEFVRQFKTEAAVTASINHPHVVQVYSAGADHGMLYIAMEIVDKGSLDDLMSKLGTVPEAQVLDVGIQIAQGLLAALKRGLIHRDIKPGNILFSNPHNAKIVDFGLAALMDEAGTVGGEVWGTPYYVAPEKLDAQPEDARSDIYSLGATLFHALAGKPPFDADTASMSALKKVKSQPVSLQSFAPHISSTTAYVINKTLHKDPNQRHQSYEELIEHLEYARTELRAYIRQAGVPVVKARAKTAHLGAAKKNSDWITYGVVGTVVLGGLGYYFWSHDASPKPYGAKGATPALVQPAVPTHAEERLAAGRELLLSGKYADAEQTLLALDAEKSVPQNLHNWVTLHAGLAQWLANHEKEGRETFAKIEQRGATAGDEAEVRLARFFLGLSKELGHPELAANYTDRNFDTSNYQVFGLLLVGIKNWQAGKFEEAGKFFREFNSATPQPAPGAWLGDEATQKRFKKIAGEYLAELREFKVATEALKKADAFEQKKEAFEISKASLAKMRPSGKLTRQLSITLAKLEPEITEQLEKDASEAAKKLAQQEASDSRALSEARQKYATLLALYKFSDAKAVMLSAKIAGEKCRKEQETLVSKCEWLIKVKTTLQRDLTTVGYSAPLARKAGPPLSGGVTKADELQFYVRNQYGSLPVLWTDVAPDALFAIAQSFVKPTATPDALAERKLLLGVFALYLNKPTEGRALFTEAAQLHPDYASVTALFLEAE